jgi:hypothetical protein
MPASCELSGGCPFGPRSLWARKVADGRYAYSSHADLARYPSVQSSRGGDRSIARHGGTHLSDLTLDERLNEANARSQAVRMAAPPLKDKIRKASRRYSTAGTKSQPAAATTLGFAARRCSPGGARHQHSGDMAQRSYDRLRDQSPPTSAMCAPLPSAWLEMSGSRS